MNDRSRVAGNAAALVELGRPGITSSTVRARLIADCAVRLPPLATTSIRGALLQALRDLVCLNPERPHCGGCAEQATCAFSLLTPESVRDAGGGQGDLAPSPIVLRPVSPSWTGASQQLPAGAEVVVDVTLIGARAMQERALLRAALLQVARGGIGLEGLRDRRPSFTLASVCEVTRVSLEPAGTWHVVLLSPLRARAGERDVDRTGFSAEVLWNVLVRRARHLLLVAGTTPPSLPDRAPFTIESARLDDALVRRWSNRQGARNTWRGVTGELVLRVAPGSEVLVAALLSLARDLGIGKGTSFGLGAIECQQAGAGASWDRGRGGGDS